MSTKTTTATTNAYNSGSMNTYNSMQPQLQGLWSQMIQNPLGTSFFKNQLAQSQANANQIGQRSNTNVLRNMRAGGGLLSNSAGFMQGVLTRNQTQNNMLQANSFNSALNTALQNRNWAAMSAEAYQPLQTGQTSTQTQSGVGTWLPQVAGMALNMAMPGIGSVLGGGSFGAGYRGGSSAPSGGMPTTGMMRNPFGTGGNVPFMQSPNPFMNNSNPY